MLFEQINQNYNGKFGQVKNILYFCANKYAENPIANKYMTNKINGNLPHLVKSAMLTAALCLTLPTMAKADEVFPHTDYCGDDVHYTIQEDLNLTISGTGATYDYTYREAPGVDGDHDADSGYDVLAPRRRAKAEDTEHYTDERFLFNRATTATVEAGVTRLGNCFFYDCADLTSITIASTIEEIGTQAFYLCSSLNEIKVIATTPAVLESSDVFNDVDKSTCTLYVPYGTTAAYRAAGYNFDNIVEMGTDLSQFSDVIYVEPLTVQPGETATVSVMMTNQTVSVRSYEFSVALPEGISFVANEDGDYASISSGRFSSSSCIFASEIQSDGSLKVVFTPTGSAMIKGTEGEICTFTINVPEGTADGSYSISVKDAVLSDDGTPNPNKFEIEDEIVSCLTVQDYLLGDANNDGNISIGDVMAVLNKIAGNTVDNFNEKAADANQDSKITIGDVMVILTMIANK